MSKSQAEGGTRSGLLWEVERILGELGQDELPQILLMENVPQILNKKNLPDFHKWQNRLEELGYKNYVEVLNARDFGIPQNRKRCFMISILGDYSYDWPEPFELKYRLKDFLDSEVDKKYFLSEKMLRYIVSTNDKYSGSQQPAKVNKTIASCITTKVERRCDVSTYIAPELPDEIDLRDKIAIKNATKQGYLIAEEGDGIDIAQRSGHRGTVQKGTAQTLKTEIDVGVAVIEEKKLLVRKLTPRECYKLMGFERKDHDAVEAYGQPDGQRYHEAGDSIVVTVLMAIFNQLLGEENYREKVTKYTAKLVEQVGGTVKRSGTG